MDAWDNASTELSGVLKAHLHGRTILRIVSGALDESRTIDVTPQIKVIYINPRRRPFIEASTEDIVLLD